MSQGGMIKGLRFIISILLILGGVGSIIFGLYPVIASVLIMLGVIGAVFSYLSSESQNQERDFLIDAQATLLAQHNLGNIYTDALKKELSRTGSVKKSTRFLKKALDVNPNDSDALALLASSISLHLSLLKRLGQRTDSKEFVYKFGYAKTLAQKGIQLYPYNHNFIDVLGILLDTEGKHEDARKQFVKSSRLRNDSYWRLLIATSWHMSGADRKALHEVELAEKEGATGWLFDFYYGRALNRVGNSMQAVDYLKSAYNKSGNKPDILKELSISYYDSGRFFAAAKYDFLSAMTIIPIYPRSGVRSLLQGIWRVTIGLTCFTSRACWKVTKHVPLIRHLQLRFIPPDEPEFTLGNMQINKGRYEAAEQKFRLSCSIVPNKAGSHLNLALCLALQGRKNEALSECDKAIKLEPKDRRFQHSREQIAAGNMKRIVDQHGNIIRNI